jgi:hypothetical protein
MSFNVNFLGHLPYNPDELPERNYLTGSGSDRPIGLTLGEMVKLYWTVRSYRVRIGSSSIGGDDPFTQFIEGGGNTGGIIGANAGLANINLGGSGNNANLNGYTKIINTYRKKIRKEREGVINGVTQKTVEIDKSISPNIITSSIVRVNEGVLCSAGPIHTFVGASGYVKIDMSDIVFAKRLYWPKIFILLQSSSLSMSSKIAGYAGNINVLGGVKFSTYGVIPFYGSSFSRNTPTLVSVDGSIEIGTRCCDRFYWDGGDESRFNETCKKDCESTVSTLGQRFGGKLI